MLKRIIITTVSAVFLLLAVAACKVPDFSGSAKGNSNGGTATVHVSHPKKAKCAHDTEGGICDQGNDSGEGSGG